MKTSVIKKKADTVLIEVFKSIFEEIEISKIRTEVETLRRSNPNFDPMAQAETLTRRTAIRCAATGAVTGLPSGLMAVAILGADIAYLVFQQFRLILGIATIYGREPSHRERFNEALACLAYGSGLTLGKHGITAMLESASLEGGVVAEKLGTRLFGDRLSRVIPFVGAFSGGALNYFAVRAVGRTTMRYYDGLVDPALAEEIWQEGDREHA